MFEVRVVFKLRVNTENITIVFQAPKSKSPTLDKRHVLSPVDRVAIQNCSRQLAHFLAGAVGSC